MEGTAIVFIEQRKIMHPEVLELMKSSLSILLDNEYVELMYFSEDILVVISIIFSMDLHHIRLL
jgi:thiazole synthase ThiGH ThiG subunit